jgi:hypothetical protein
VALDTPWVAHTPENLALVLAPVLVHAVLAPLP